MPRLMRLSSMVICLAVTVAACTEPAPRSIEIIFGQQTLAVAQGASGSIPITLNRSGFEGPVTFTASGLPEGVTATFAPANLTGTTNSASVTFNVATSATAGEAAVTITAHGTSIQPASATLALTILIAGDFALGASPTAMTVARGANATATIAVIRIDGFGQNVTLSASGLPAGVTASFSPVTAGPSSTVTFAASASAAIGQASVTVTGASPGVPDRTTTIDLTVEATATMTPVSINFCTSEAPTWIAYRNSGGTWIQAAVDGANTASFSATPKVELAYVWATGPGARIEVRQLTVADLAPINGVTCVQNAGQIHGGSVAGVPEGSAASISRASAGASVAPPNIGYTLFNVDAGALDVVASRSVQQSVLWSADKVVIRRALDLAPGAEIPVIDFESSEAVAPTTSTLTITGMSGAPEYAIVENNLQARAGAGVRSTFHRMFFGYYTTAPITLRSVPASLRTAHDMHHLYASESSGGTQPRGAFLFHDGSANITLPFGAKLAAPTASVIANSPYARHRVQVSAGEYAGSVQFDVAQEPRTLLLYTSAAFLGTTPTTWDLEMPDFSGVSGWSDSWALTGVGATQVRVLAMTAGAPTFGVPAPEGLIVKFARNNPAP